MPVAILRGRLVLAGVAVAAVLLLLLLLLRGRLLLVLRCGGAAGFALTFFHSSGYSFCCLVGT